MLLIYCTYLYLATLYCKLHNTVFTSYQDMRYTINGLNYIFPVCFQTTNHKPTKQKTKPNYHPIPNDHKNQFTPQRYDYITEFSGFEHWNFEFVIYLKFGACVLVLCHKINKQLHV